MNHRLLRRVLLKVTAAVSALIFSGAFAGLHGLAAAQPATGPNLIRQENEMAAESSPVDPGSLTELWQQRTMGRETR